MLLQIDDYRYTSASSASDIDKLASECSRLSDAVVLVAVRAQHVLESLVSDIDDDMLHVHREEIDAYLERACSSLVDAMKALHRTRESAYLERIVRSESES